MDGAFLPHTGGEVLVNSGPYTGLPADEGGRRILAELEASGKGAAAVTYRLRDWLISRQRYWGSPIPIVYKQDGTMETVPDDKLPVLLPEDSEFIPSGRSPLTYDERFLNTTARDGSPARRSSE